MPRIRPLRKPEEIAAVPPDQEVMIDLTPEEPHEVETAVPPSIDEPESTAALRKQLEAAQNAEKMQRERADAEEK